MVIDPDVDAVAAELHGQKGFGVWSDARVVAHAPLVIREIMREIGCRRHLGIGVHVRPVVHGTDRFALDEVEGVVEVLCVAPDREARVFLERPFGHDGLGADGSLRLERSERREPHARQQHDERPAEAPDADRLLEPTVPAEHRGGIRQSRRRDRKIDLRNEIRQQESCAGFVKS